MSINGIGKLLNSLDDRLRAKGYTEDQIWEIRRAALTPLCARLGIAPPPEKKPGCSPLSDNAEPAALAPKVPT